MTFNGYEYSAALRKQRERGPCMCGHTRAWHYDEGAGACGFDAEPNPALPQRICKCVRFDLDLDRGSPDDKRDR